MFWDPFDELNRINNDMNTLFNRAFRSPLIEQEGNKDLKVYRNPVCDLCETENGFMATFEIPGANKEDISLDVSKNAIELKVESRNEHEEKKKSSESFMRSYSSFYRKIPLPEEVEPDKVEATYKDGILKISIPKVKKVEEKTKKIEIK